MTEDRRAPEDRAEDPLDGPAGAERPQRGEADSLRRTVKESLRYGLRQWTASMAGSELEARLARGRPPSEYGVDSFGFSLDFALDAIAPFLWLYRSYFRCETHGAHQVPPGRVLLVSNHGGQLPLDGAMIGVAMLTEADPPRCVRSMVERWIPTLPFVSTFFARMGQIVGTPENCRRLLERDEAILVFPEGVKGMSKLWRDRYRLQPFGHGFMRLALQTQTPIVPVAVIGAEEQSPALFNVKPLAELLGFPAFPVTPTLVPFPLPTKYRIYFGAPLRFEGRSDDDDAELEPKVERVRGEIAAMLERGLRERPGVFW